MFGIPSVPEKEETAAFLQSRSRQPAADLGGYTNSNKSRVVRSEAQIPSLVLVRTGNEASHTECWDYIAHSDPHAKVEAHTPHTVCVWT